MIGDMKKQNQQIEPRKKKEQQKYRCFFKSGNSSMLLTKDIGYGAAVVLENKIKMFLSEHGCKLEGTFIVTK